MSKKRELEAFYDGELKTALKRVHPSLVFNMDEMGADRFADRKRVKVFVPEDQAPESGVIEAGVPRSTDR